jgi:hypothetical protein
VFNTYNSFAVELDSCAIIIFLNHTISEIHRSAATSSQTSRPEAKLLPDSQHKTSTHLPHPALNDGVDELPQRQDTFGGRLEVCP